MRVLLCGATGFIGRHIARALRDHGHQVVAASRGGREAVGQEALAVNLMAMTQPRDWLPLLASVDAVINAVGVLRDSRRQPMRLLHTQAPQALFQACAEAGVRRVLQVSALGIEGQGSAYARTKAEADGTLLALTQHGALDGVVLRPSVVFGRGGAGSELFVAMSRLPWLALPPEGRRTLIQPVAVQDLAEACAQLLGPALAQRGLMVCTGPQALSLEALLASLRQQRGDKPARVGTMPAALARSSAWAGDLLPFTPWGRQTLGLLQRDNTASAAEAAQFAAVLGHAPCPPDRLLAQR
ncbi:MAG TPA: NAD-dependent epimerase/dehydratase family protein [Ideonella sp.]|uniref:NAD-dependent epimerase/dehydratase family protein n=1 Tax=Ideonella sp. TaxID=1929293 RepID=UPI002D028AD9|nr:NAD-dependent epimerase/dehydratase family protein [Ideonella sp.]HSI49358.1 NAD-dependent epimerase/dehydratase family protein [Ideonella sp.]